MRKINILSVAFLSLLLASCTDFLSESSQDLTYARTASDLDEILVGDGYMKVQDNSSSTPTLGAETSFYFPFINIMDDDAAMEAKYGNASREDFLGFFTWGRYPYMRENEVVIDDTWKRLYKHISVVNVVLKKAEELTDKPEDLARIKGECLVLRASFYYFLVNFYAKPYSKTTAATDLGVPIKTTEFIEDIYFSRNTVEEVYNLIVSDLERASDLLKGKRKKIVFRADYHAAQAFLSRIYLYMENYDGVIETTDEVLKGSYQLLDYNTLAEIPNDYTSVATTYKDSPETIFSQGGNSLDRGGIMAQNLYKASDELMTMYDHSGDLRRKYYFYSESDPTTFYPCKVNSREPGSVSSHFLLRLPEVMLNRAEALAMNSQWGDARNILDELRKKRIKIGDVYTVTATDGQQTIDYIRAERRRELCFEGQRWFDLRRYAVNTKYPLNNEIVHDVYHVTESTDWQSAYKGSVKLNKYATEPAYVLPIPQHVIEYNRGKIVDNEIRPDREFFIK